MTWLKKIGQVLAAGIAVATGLGPVLAQFFGAKGQTDASNVVNDLTQIGQVVISAEALIQTPGSGATKLQAATPLVANVVKTSELLAGKEIANETLFIQGCTEITAAVADILNSLKPSGVSTQGQPITAAAVPPTPPPAPAVTPAIVEKMTAAEAPAPAAPASGPQAAAPAPTSTEVKGL